MSSRDDIFKKLTTIFHDVFDDETIVLADELTANDIEDWDSISNIILIIQMENVFGFKFDVEEILELNNIGQMIDLIEKKIS